MRDLLSWVLVLAAAIVALGSIYYTHERALPCARPVAYAVGSIDPAFGVATSTVITEAKAAAGIWNKAAGKSVLAYDPKAALKISLVYDAREAAAKLGTSLAEQNAALDSERERLDALHAALAADDAAYEQEVRDANAHGGATPAEFATLETERKALAARSADLNQQADTFNAKVAAFNANAKSYNTTAGHTFEEGHYVQDGGGAHIEIYEFVGATQLERVLAHELGHAIGLGHNSDPASIMYAENESGKLTPSAADLTALKALCGA